MREKAALAEWAEVRDIILRLSAFPGRPTPRVLAQFFSPYGTIRDIIFMKKNKINIIYLTLQGSAWRAYRACRALSAHALDETKPPPQVTFAGRNPKDVTVINGLLFAYASRYEAVAKKQEEAGDRPLVTSFMLHVGWLLEPVSMQQVEEFFRAYGRAALVKVMVNRGCAGYPRTFAIVNLRTTRERAVSACVELTGTMLGGSMVEVSSLKKYKGKEMNKRLAMQEEVERRMREKIRSQLPPSTTATANERIELAVSGLGEMTREKLINVLAPYGLAVEGTGEVVEGKSNITLLTTPDTAISACKGTLHYGKYVGSDYNIYRNFDFIAKYLIIKLRMLTVLFSS